MFHRVQTTNLIPQTQPKAGQLQRLTATMRSDVVRFGAKENTQQTDAQKTNRKAQRKKVITGVSLMAAGAGAVVASLLLKASVIGITPAILLGIVGAGLIVGGIWVLARKTPPPEEPPAVVAPEEPQPDPEKTAFLQDPATICFYTKSSNGKENFEFNQEGQFVNNSMILNQLRLEHKTRSNVTRVIVIDHRSNPPKKVLNITFEEELYGERVKEQIAIVSSNDQLSPIQRRILSKLKDSQTIPAVINGLHECVENKKPKAQFLEAVWVAGDQPLDAANKPNYCKDIQLIDS